MYKRQSLSLSEPDAGSERVAVLTPYVDELNVKIRESLASTGIEVIDIEGFGIDDNFGLAEPMPQEIADRAIKLVDRCEPDPLFISCTNFRALEAVARIEATTGIPVVTSNRAVAAAVRKTLEDLA